MTTQTCAGEAGPIFLPAPQQGRKSAPNQKVPSPRFTHVVVAGTDRDRRGHHESHGDLFETSPSEGAFRRTMRIASNRFTGTPIRFAAAGPVP